MKHLLAALLLTFALPVAAQPYVFAGAASSRASGEGQVAEDSSDLFLSPGLGYRFSEHFAVEAAYMDPGNVLSTFSQSAPAPGQVVATMRDLDVSGSRLSILGSVPLGERLSLLGSLSAYRLKATATEVDTLTVATPPSQTVTGVRSASSTSSTTGAGLGLGYRLSEKFDGRMMIDWIRGKDDALADLPRLRVLSFSVAYSF